VTATLSLGNRQRSRPVNLVVLRRLVRVLLCDFLQRQTFDLGVYLVGAAEMTRLNQTWLQHEGSTDVITFDYTDPADPARLSGEIFVCVDEALAQATRFHTTWESELARYVVHGVLHLDGYDDQAVADRRRMKRQEHRLLRLLSRRVALRQLNRPRRRSFP
jgi:probable rRNA maturation factor